MIDKSKTYRTRDGREVRIYATDGGEVFPVHGAIRYSDISWQATQWDAKGYYGVGTKNDLIEVRPRIKRTVWLNVYCGFVWGYESKKAADEGSHETRLACVRVEIDCEEGDGL